MSEIVYFVVAITHIGTWLAKMTHSDHENWRHNRTKAVLNDVRGLIIEPHPDGKRVMVSIGDPYTLATATKEIIVDPIAIEIMGEVEEVDGAVTCKTNAKLFSDYDHALSAWRAAQANITLAKASDMPGVSLG
jgi:hypothetical protein